MSIRVSLPTDSKMYRARRNLFGRETEEERQTTLRKINDKLDGDAVEMSTKYNFDFKEFTPLVGRFRWMEVSSDEVHPVYNRTVSTTSCFYEELNNNLNNTSSESDIELDLAVENRTDEIIQGCSHTEEKQTKVTDFYPVVKNSPKRSVQTKRKNPDGLSGHSSRKRTKQTQR